MQKFISPRKFTLVLWIGDDAASVQDATLRIVGWDEQPGEMVLVSTIPIDVSPAVKFDGCFRQIVAREGETVWHGLNEAIRTTNGNWIAFLNARFIADAAWLTRLGSCLIDPKVGCACGDVIVGHDGNSGDSVDRSRQRIALSGWRGLSYACFDNAAFRREVFDKVGELNPSLGPAAAVDIADRILRHTDFRIAYVPDAAVTAGAPADPATIWDNEAEAACAFREWIRQSEKPEAIPLAKTITTARDSMVELVRRLDLLWPTHRAEAAVARASLQHVAGLVGVLKDAASSGRGAEAGSLRPPCSLCGGRTYVPGPGGRMAGQIAPQCGGCGSLERHRVQDLLLQAIDPENATGMDVLSVGEALRKEQRCFRNHSHMAFDKLLANDAHITTDLLMATNFFSSSFCPTIDAGLEALVRYLKDESILIVLEQLQTSRSATVPRPGGGGHLIGGDLGALLSRLLPEISVGSSLFQDDVTKDVMIAVVAAPDPQVVSRVLTGAQAAMFARGAR